MLCSGVCSGTKVCLNSGNFLSPQNCFMGVISPLTPKKILITNWKHTLYKFDHWNIGCRKCPKLPYKMDAKWCGFSKSKNSRHRSALRFRARGEGGLRQAGDRIWADFYTHTSIVHASSIVAYWKKENASTNIQSVYDKSEYFPVSLSSISVRPCSRKNLSANISLLVWWRWWFSHLFVRDF